MRRNILMLIPIVFAVLTVVSVVVGLRVKKTALQTRFSTEVAAVKTEKVAFGGADLMVARQIVSGLAKAHNLPLKVTVSEGGTLTIAGGIEESPTDGQAHLTAAKLPAEDIKTAVLSQFSGITGFLRTLSALPYQADFKSLCIGMECTTGFDAVVHIAGKR